MKAKFTSVALLGAGLALFAGPMALKADTAAPQPRVLTVSGEGEVSAVPDSAQLSAGVTTQARTAADALAANTRAMNEVFATLKKFGIPEKSIQTSNFNVSPQYTPYQPNATQPPRIVGYQVSNNVTVKVDDLKKLGSALDALVSSGANQVGGVSFTVSDPKPLMIEARQAAVKDALDRAQTYAKAAGVELGPVLTLNESGSEAPRPVMYAMARAESLQSVPVPVAAGEQTISANVTMSFEIR